MRRAQSPRKKRDSEENVQGSELAIHHGFLCPACDTVVKFETEELLRNHWFVGHVPCGARISFGIMGCESLLAC